MFQRTYHVLCIVGVIFLGGCQSSWQAVNARYTKQKDRMPELQTMKLFEAQHADLFFPFSYQLLSFTVVPYQEHEQYIIRMNLAASKSDIIPQYIQFMELNGWHTVMATPDTLLFEKPWSRCMVTLYGVDHALMATLTYADIPPDAS